MDHPPSSILPSNSCPQLNHSTSPVSAEDIKRILVFGSGAVGCLVGGLLANQGHQVAFVGRRPIVDAIRRNGIRIDGLWGEHCIPPQALAYEAIRDISSDFNPEWILITTKTYATESAIEACRPYVTPNAMVCSLQNGLGNLETIANRVGWPQTIGGRIITGVEIQTGDNAPVAIRVTVHADDVRLGHPHNALDPVTIEAMAGICRKAGIRIQATQDVLKYIWAKVFYNAALNPLGAILGCCYGDLAEQPGTRETMNRIVREGFAVTQACGIEQFWPDAEAYLDAFYSDMVPKTATHFPSMLRDIQQGRQTEIQALNGAIVRLGERHGIEVPTNRCITEMLEFLERSRMNERANS